MRLLISIQYDALGRLIKEESQNITKEYTYDAANNRKTFVLKQNGTVKINTSYTYDTLDRLYQIYENGQLAVTYTYDINGNRETLTYPNGNTTTYTYNLTNKKGTVELSKKHLHLFFRRQPDQQNRTGEQSNGICI